ncbi:MAG: class I SAM-dependent methyltransferase [Rhodospirillales bacterium]|nr:class I SAM-dependent methyltransferase [Rhodospirillales bacterium]
MKNSDFAAVHLDGGNFFDDLRVDIEKSHVTLNRLDVRKVRRRKPALLNLGRFAVSGLLQKFKLQEFLAISGLKRRWFNEFHGYWTDVLGGRPLSVLDFFLLLHDYRKKQQHTNALEWTSPERHVQNWQDPSELYSTFAFTRNIALRPIVGPALWRHLPKRGEVLEYGCSLAPYYHCYREFFSHRECRWTLADIANFPFHCARYLYRHDEDVAFHTIRPDRFRDPLESTKGFDVVILTTVLEHLDDPVFVADYLLARLNPGGLFVFDYIISEGKGLDTPKALEMRADCLSAILSKVEIVHGKVDATKDVGLVIARRR